MPPDMLFVLIIVFFAFTAGLTAIRMILNHLKWRAEQKKQGNVGLSELRTLFEEAALEANAGLEARLDEIERRLDPAALDAARTDVGDLLDLPEAEKTVGRAPRQRSGS